MFTNKTALITGSTSGIGLGIAEMLAKNHANIVLNGFGDQQVIENIKNKIAADFNVEVIYSSADISKQHEVALMVEQAIAKFGSIDILVNNAGIQYVAPIDEFPEDKWDAVIATNLSSSFYTIKACLPLMKKNNFGRIINIASAHGLVASANKSAYVAAKHGVIGLTKVVALEMADHNITANAICPGWVYTPLVAKQVEEIAKNDNLSLEDAKKKLLFEKHPSLSFVLPEEIGETVCFLASNAARSITGTSISVDRGWTAR